MPEEHPAEQTCRVLLIGFECLEGGDSMASEDNGKFVTIDNVTYVNGKGLSWTLGISKARVSQLESEGVIFREETEHGNLYNLAESVQAYIDKKNQDADEDGMKARRSKERAEANLKSVKAQIAKMELDELRGNFHRAEDIQTLTDDFLFEIRGMIMSLPGQLATEVAASDSPAECAAIIRTVVNRLLLDMTKYRYDPAKYEQRVRERRNWEALEEEDDDE